MIAVTGIAVGFVGACAVVVALGSAVAVWVSLQFRRSSGVTDGFRSRAGEVSPTTAGILEGPAQLSVLRVDGGSDGMNPVGDGHVGAA